MKSAADDCHCQAPRASAAGNVAPLAASRMDRLIRVRCCAGPCPAARECREPGDRRHLRPRSAAAGGRSSDGVWWRHHEVKGASPSRCASRGRSQKRWARHEAAHRSRCAAVCQASSRSMGRRQSGAGYTHASRFMRRRAFKDAVTMTGPEAPETTTPVRPSPHPIADTCSCATEQQGRPAGRPLLSAHTAPAIRSH